MTKSKNTKHALLLSIISMLLCVAMLAGSTFAWFTDSVSSGTNRIVAGNLDVQLFYKTGDMTDWRDVETLTSDDADPFFRNVDGEKILWEPGAIGITSFKVQNAGTLAFKYALALLAVNYNQLDGKDLRDMIKIAVIDGELPEDITAEEARELDYSDFHEFTKRSYLLPDDGVADSGPDQEIYTIVAYWKPNSDEIDNLYNVSNGKIATELDGTPSEPNALYLDMDIRLNAWQKPEEEDSFNNQYDAMADVLDIFPDGCYAVTDHDNWVELDVYTGRSTEEISIKYNGYAPDNTDELMRDWVTNGSGKINPDAANGDTHLIFFKTATAEGKHSFVLTQEGRVLPALPVEEDGTISLSKVVYSAKNPVSAAAAVNEVSAPAVTADLSKAITVSGEAEMLNVLADLNQNGGEKVVKLGGNIDLTKQWSLTDGTLTILGEGHSINFKESVSFSITNNATLNLGADGYSPKLYVNCLCTYNGVPLIFVGGNALMNICEGAVIDGKGYAVASGVSIAGNATVNLLGGTIQNCNSLGTHGGGIMITNSSTFNMWRGEIKDCSSQLGGGAVILFQEASASLPEIPATFNMYDGTISNCSGGSAGAIRVTENSEFNMSGGTIENCTSSKFSGGVFTGGTAVFNMSGGKIESCKGANGGGVFMQENSKFNMSGDATIVNCEGGAGGGVCMIGSTKFNMSGDATIVSCEGAVGGGVGMLHYSKFNMSGGTIRECVAKAAGGGIYMQDTTVFDMSGGTICDCVAQEVGGGVYMEGPTVFNMSGETKLYNNTAGAGGDDIARGDSDTTLILGNVNTDVELSDGYALDGWYIDEPDNRWGSEDYPYDESKIAAGETTAQFIKAAHGVTTVMKGVGAPGRLLDLYDGEDNSGAISNGGAKTVKWLLKNSGLADRVNASAPIKAGTKITMAYKDADSTRVNYYYLIVDEDTTSVLLKDFTVMGGSEQFVPGAQVRDPIYQFSFVFPEDQGNMDVWMSDTANDASNESAVSIRFTGASVSVPSGKLEANGYTVTVSGLAGLAADQSDSRHNANKPLANRKAVLALEAVDAQGRNVAMSSDTVVTLDERQVKVSTGIAAAEITGDGTYTIDVELPQGAVGIRVSLCYTYNSIIYKSMANVVDSVTVK